MKKFFKGILFVFMILGAIYLYRNTKILDFILYEKTVVIDKKEYENNYYFNKLNDIEKEVYAYVAKSTKELQEEVRIKTTNTKTITTTELQSNINKALEAYRYDYPEIFYLNSTYEIKISTNSYNHIINIILDYTITDVEKIKQKQVLMEERVQEIISTIITKSMSDYEKEVAIHDYLTKNIKYYNYGDINSIPSEMHNAYNALVNNEAVCDGISKAFQIIMNSLGIECITVGGILDGVSHAWNIIKIKNKYYHVDITSDKYTTKEEYLGVFHAYFNISDEKISHTHFIDNKYILPKCIYTESEYYNEDNTIKSSDDFKTKLYKIVQRNENRDLLELKIENRQGAASNLINYLYEMNFNNYKGRNITSLKYSVIRDVYIIPIDN